MQPAVDRVLVGGAEANCRLCLRGPDVGGVARPTEPFVRR
jgi:hypothetical protein